MRIVIEGSLFTGTPKECFDLVDRVHRKDMIKAGLWWEEDEIKYQKKINEDK